MVQNVLVSIVCPVYNTARYLPKAIESVLRQSFSNLELILVVDASPDNSIEIIKQYQTQDKRIRLLVNESNIGVDRSRFRGIKESKGKYIFFLDSDDWIPLDSLLRLYNMAEIEQSDIVYGSFTRTLDKFGFLKKKNTNNYTNNPLRGNITQPELFEKYFISYFGVNLLYVSLCGKLYLRETIIKADLKPTGMKMGEDLIFNLKLHPFLNKVSFIDEVVYYYRWGGMTSSHNPSFLSDIKKQYAVKKEEIEKYDYTKARPYIKYELVNCFFSHFLNEMLINKRSESLVKDMIVKELGDLIYTNELSNVHGEKAMLLVNKDYLKIMDKLTYMYNKMRVKYYFKKLISSILN